MRLSQVFINILSNAAKFTPEGGKITVDIEELESDPKGFASYRFLFSDTGIGMKPEFVKDIFSTFSREQDTRKNGIEGTGLGMAISKRIVDEMHGKISVKSQRGKGSVFTVELKFQLDNNGLESMPMPVLRILVAGDDTAGCSHITDTLHSLGMNMVWVKDRASAVIKIGEARRDNQAYDAVIWDAKLKSVDMQEYIREVRSEIGSDIPVLFTCSYDCDEIDEKVITAGLNAYIREPVFPSKLCRKLSLLVSPQNGEQEENSNIGDCDFTGCRFLLVEDNELNREIASELLSATNAIVETACNGEEGLQSFENAPIGYYTLIFMDIQMPVMDGYTATRKIRKLNRPDAGTIPIIAMTANAFAEDVAACIEAGMTAHLAKPLDMQIIQKTIQAHIMPGQAIETF